MTNRFLIEAAKKRNVYFILVSALALVFLVAYFSISIEEDQTRKMNAERKMRRKHLIQHFNVSSYDASEITWAHAINSKQQLSETLNSRISNLIFKIFYFELLVGRALAS
jgi:hypothetical protein